MKRIMIPAANQPGALTAITRLLAEGDVDIRSLDAEESEGHGADSVIQLVAEPYDLALTLLREAGYSAVTEDAILIRVQDQPGSLARVAARLSDAGVNVRSLHILYRKNCESLVSLVTDNNEKAVKVVGDLLVGGQGI